MAAQPDVYFWKISGGGAINQFGTGGASGTALTSSPFDFGSVQAGFYTPPAILLVEFRNGGLASDIDLRVYDTDPSQSGGASADPMNQIVTSLGDDIFANYPTSWKFNISCKDTWQDPTNTGLFSLDPANSAMKWWDELKWGATPFRLAMPGTGNDGTTNLLVTHQSQNVEPNLRRFTNFFIYITALPKPTATAGEHLGWGLRTTFTYT